MRNMHKWRALTEQLKKEISEYILAHPEYANAGINMSAEHQPQAGRAVCSACMMGDTLGRCHQIWCPNSGNACSQYVKQQGDYWYHLKPKARKAEGQE